MWAFAIDSPSSVRPTFTITIGFFSVAAWSAASMRVRPSLNPSMYAGDHTDVRLVGEVAGEVGELEVDLVPRRRPVRQPDADLLALEHGPALVAALGDERDRRPGEVGAELLERVEVRVGAEQMHLAVAHEVVEAGLELGAVLAGLGEPGGEDHREGGLALQHLFEGVDGLAGEDDGEIEIAGHVEHRGVAALTEHCLVARVHGVEGRTVGVGPALDLAGHGRVRLA